jgi:hypothetical protein
LNDDEQWQTSLFVICVGDVQIVAAVGRVVPGMQHVWKGPLTWCGDVVWWRGMATWHLALVMRGGGVVVVRESLAKWVGTKRDEGTHCGVPQ